MASPTASTSPAAPPPDEAAAMAALKRYENLTVVRAKAINGKGAWYWNHLVPILVQSSDSSVPNAVKLRCSLCESVFSASNPSRTASEHLKRGTCPNFTAPASIGGVDTSSPVPISTVQPCSSSGEGSTPRPITTLQPCSFQHHRGRKRSASYQHLAIMGSSSSGGGDAIHSPPPAAQQHLGLSGGKEDMGALAMLEDSVNKLKNPNAAAATALPKPQADAALSYLTDWFYECGGAAALSAADHPKFRAFLHQVGLPPLSRRELAGGRLDARYSAASAAADAKLRCANNFQLAARGWHSDTIVGITLNLPNGSSVFRRAIVNRVQSTSDYCELILDGEVGGDRRCAGIVSDRFKKGIRNLETRHQWMVNLSCQAAAFRSLVDHLAGELPMFRSASTNCSKLASLFNTNQQLRTLFHKYQLQELGHAGLLSLRVNNVDCFDDILASARPLHMVIHDESYKHLCLEDQNARELAEMIGDSAFWTRLEAANSLVRIINSEVREMEVERPLVGQCLPLWDDLRLKVKSWCGKYSIDEGIVCNVIDRRFRKHYHPAWAAAFILDPLYLIRDASGRYLPPFKCLTTEQEKDVDNLIMRLVSRDEAHIVLMELMKWRSEGLDPVYAQAVQVKQPDPVTGKMKVANPQGSRIVWETYLSEFKSLAKVAVRLIFLHATSSGFTCNTSLRQWVSSHPRSREAMDRAQKMIFISANAKLERRQFLSEEEMDAELFADDNDDAVKEAFFDPSSV